MDQRGPELVWAGPGVAQFSDDVVQAGFERLGQDGLSLLQSKTPVGTGELRDSDYVQLSVANGRAQLEIGATAGHTVSVELGTGPHAPQRCIRPTCDELQRLVGPTLQAEARAKGGGS